MILARSAAFALVSALVFSSPQTPHQEDDTEHLDAAQPEVMDAGELVQPLVAESNARAILSRPLDEQTEDQLLATAAQANAAMRFVGFIQEGYGQSHSYVVDRRGFYRAYDAYRSLSERLAEFRNQAYFNVGKKMVERGDRANAFRYYREAFRLSSFTDYRGDHKGLRYQAEVEMKRLLGLESMETFLY